MIRWLVQTVVDHPDLTAGRPPTGLLTAAELAQFHTYLSPQRRRDWLLGRWTSKRLVSIHMAATAGFSPALNSFTVEQAPSGAPYLASQHPALRGNCDDGRLPLALSISHSHGYAFCILSGDSHIASVRLGADIELVEPRTDGFAHEFFTTEEQANLNRASPAQRQLLATAIWSAKEAVLKATHLGLRIDPRSLQCILSPDRLRSWTPLRVEMQPASQTQIGELGPVRVWWRVLENRLRPGTAFILAIAAYRISI